MVFFRFHQQMWASWQEGGIKYLKQAMKQMKFAFGLKHHCFLNQNNQFRLFNDCLPGI